MKFELKTESEKYTKSSSQFFWVFFIITLIIILCDVSLKLGSISRSHEIDYNCRVLSVEKSKSQFKKLSKLSKLKSKQQIWEFCMEVIK